MRSEANIDGKIQGDTMVSYQMETTKDLQSAFVTTKEGKKNYRQEGEQKFRGWKEKSFIKNTNSSWSAVHKNISEQEVLTSHNIPLTWLSFVSHVYNTTVSSGNDLHSEC